LRVIRRHGNKTDLEDPTTKAVTKDVHLEDVLLVPPDARDLESTTPVSLQPDVDEPMRLRSIGQMLEERNGQEPVPEHRPGRGKKARLVVQQYIAYSVQVADVTAKRCRVGRIKALMDAVAVVHQYHPVNDARLRVKRYPLFRRPTIEILLDPGAGEPVCEEVPFRRVISIIEMNSGVMNHASARALDRNGYRIDESVRLDIHEEPSDEVAVNKWTLGTGEASTLEDLRNVTFVEDVSKLSTSTSTLQKWTQEEQCDFLEVFTGHCNLTTAAQRVWIRAGEPIDQEYGAYGVSWDLADKRDQQRFAYLVCERLRPAAIHVATPCTEMCVIGNQTPSPSTKALVELALHILEHQSSRNKLVSHENPKGSKFFTLPRAEKLFGQPGQSKVPWTHYPLDGCQFGLRFPGAASRKVRSIYGKELYLDSQLHTDWNGFTM
jgi:hypothetical protein